MRIQRQDADQAVCLRLNAIKAGAGLLTAVLIAGAAACDGSQDSAHLVEQHGVQIGRGQQAESNGRKLTEAAAYTIAPADDAYDQSVPEQAKPYVGRYYVQISCQDRFVNCEKGQADFIVTLLPNGIAHRTVVHLGTMTFASSKQYRQDRWSYDQSLHQIVLHRASGVEFFYDIDAQGNIVMDLDKIAKATEINRRYFEGGNPLPEQPYVLKKKNEPVNMAAGLSVPSS